jgi:hypothetical protein
MPRGDKKGPEGEGPMSGRGAGLCAGGDAPGYKNRRGVRGIGPGCGGRGRRGFRNWFHATRLPGWMRARSGDSGPGEDEIALLKNRSEFLAASLAQVNARIADLENAGSR